MTTTGVEKQSKKFFLKIEFDTAGAADKREEWDIHESARRMHSRGDALEEQKKIKTEFHSRGRGNRREGRDVDIRGDRMHSGAHSVAKNI